MPESKVKKKLRKGYTTGSCAAAAAKAATLMLLGKKDISEVPLLTPKGTMLQLTIHEIIKGDMWVRCAVCKDSGDDPDVTNGIMVFATVTLTLDKQIILDGGVGVGRVTLPGLQQRVGEAAINRVPKQMILQEVNTVCEQYGYDGGVRVVIDIPEGERIAKKTFNERLGIIGGLSILGTTGIVEPMSESALIESIQLEIKVKKANHQEILVVTPGNYGIDFLKQELQVDISQALKCSNYIGETLDTASEVGFNKILMVGHIGKFVKLAAGIMNTHSKQADARAEIFLANAALEGVSATTLQLIENAITTDEMVSILKKSGNLQAVMTRVMRRIQYYVKYRTDDKINIEVIVFSLEEGLLGTTKGAFELINEIKRGEI